MRPVPFLQNRLSRRRGVALVIVLAFVVLLTVLVVAFFSRAILNRQISNSSMYHADADSFAHGAADDIIANLQTEIALASTGTTYSTGTTSVSGTLYTPSTPMAAVPQISGTDATTNTTSAPNLVKLSRHGILFFSGAVDGLSSTISIPTGGVSDVVNVSSTTPSLNGRFISPARWNAHYLLPLANTTDSTPANFHAPDWTLVARDGSHPAPTAISSSMTVSATATSTVIGRYAYAIYNEGGLLDANVAGYPDTQDNISSYRTATGLADLTQIGLSPNRITELVAWRNAYSAGLSGQSFLTTGSISGTNYYQNVVLSNTNGFLATSGSLANGQTDHVFSSRQELIKFMQNGLGLSGTSLGVLQYLGTFSRSLDQPSYYPVPGRPTVSASAYQDFSSTSGTNYGGNTGYQLDSVINPPFRTIRVTGTFARNDGSVAIIGEPLVKRRFPLNLLAWLTYKGPSALLQLNAPSDPEIQAYLADGLSPQLLAAGGTNAIKQYFGLVWTSGSGAGGLGGYWTYWGHGSVQTNTVETLNTVVTENREPDFFELLKAAYCVGGEASYTGGVYDGLGPYEGLRDTRVDNYILALGANIIDQFKPDTYPTAITFTASSSASPPLVYTFWGANELPYLMGLTYMNLLVSQAQGTPPLTSNALVNPPVLLSSSGQVVSMAFPIVFDPYAVNTADPVPSGLAPTNLRVCMTTQSAAFPTSGASNYFGVNPYYLLTSGTNSANIYLLPNGQTSASAPGNPNPYYAKAPWPAATYDTTRGIMDMPAQNTAYNAALHFNNAGTYPNANYQLYRSPTPLYAPNSPNGSSLSLENQSALMLSNAAWRNGVPELSGTTYVGFFMAKFPQRWNGPLYTIVQSGTNYVGAQTTGSATWSVNDTATLTGGWGCTISMEYSTSGANGPWIPYMQYPVCTQIAGFDSNVIVPYTNTSGSSANFTEGAVYSWSAGQSGHEMTAGYDPRTFRWGFQGGGSNQAFVDPGRTMVTTLWPAAGNGSCNYTPHGFYPGAYAGDGNYSRGRGPGSPLYYAGITNANGYVVDVDNVSRVSEAEGYDSNSQPFYVSGTSSVLGLPLSNGTDCFAAARPIMLHRPFRNVGELSYVFSGTPWRNIDFATPCSAASALLDVFCINENESPNGIVAGKVDLNTRQPLVLQAILSGGCRNETPGNSTTTLSGVTQTLPTSLTAAELNTLANTLVARTTTNPLTTTTGTGGPLSNIGDLVGRYISGAGTTALYDGYSQDVYKYYQGPIYGVSANTLVERLNNAPIRALSSCGMAGTWNLLIDVIAQTGRYPTGTTNPANFIVEGEKRYWVHVAIDRQTRQIVDEQFEPVNE